MGFIQHVNTLAPATKKLLRLLLDYASYTTVSTIARGYVALLPKNAFYSASLAGGAIVSGQSKPGNLVNLSFLSRRVSSERKVRVYS